MDLITTAIVAALARLSETVVKDAYDGLKSIIVRKSGKSSALADAVKNLEKKPDSKRRTQTLAEEVAAAKVDQDEELLEAAQTLIAKLEMQPEGRNVIRQTVTGNQNVFSATGDVTVRSDK